MIVVGTAGHIDHGKSAIVRRLTGTDPDRLPEEKARGMTIDLGFAFYRPPDSDPVALVDVPGHERFIKNMIAGAGGIDAVMLVVAADDGWMPQSEEHFQVTRLLGVRHGFVVINKIDLADSDWVELLVEDIKEKVAGSFLEGAPIIRVSAETGDGFPSLEEYINRLAAQLESRKDIGKARLPIDRSFVRPGMGGVVTGTLRGGCLQLGQTIALWPGGIKAKVRSLQSTGRDVEIAVPGQRTAVSFTGVDREKLVRGGVVSARTDLGYFAERPVLALDVEMLPTAPVPLEDRRRVQIIVGTTEVDGEVRLFDRSELKPSERGLLFFRPDNPIYALIGDRMIIRLPTPMVTLGGAAVLDHLEGFPRRKQLPSLGYLNNRLSLTPEALVLSELEKTVLCRVDNLLLNADLGAVEIDHTLEGLIKEGKVGRFESLAFATASIASESDLLERAVKEELDSQPHLMGLSIDQIKRRLPQRQDVIEPFVRYLVHAKRLEIKGDLIDLAGRGMSLKGVQKQVYDEIMTELKSHRYDPPPLTELAAGGKIHQQVIKYILDTGEGYKCGSSFIFLAETWRELESFVRDRVTQSGQLAVADLRDKFGITRRFVIPILEELDRLKVTERAGDLRVKGKNFGD
jgi:selenocysteine-specific elongation factor